MALFETVTDPIREADILRRRAYGVIEAAEGALVAIHFRPFPKVVTLPEALWWGPLRHERSDADRCRLFFNQPSRMPSFLALVYAMSGKRTSLATIHAALRTLEDVARIKRIDAIVADVQNFRIAERALRRHGWAPHAPSRWHRHYIKRYYGEYPSPGQAPAAALAQ